MIQANELRIGNLVNYICSCNEVYPVSVNMIEDEDCIHGKDLSENYFCKKCGQNFYKLYFEFLSGIPITEDILLKAGFDVVDDNMYDYENYQFGYLWREKQSFYLIFQHQQISENIYYVHELQNLIYALTGTELTINL